MSGKLKDKPRSLLCGCGRGVFKSLPIRIVTDDPISYESEQLVGLECVFCGRDLLLDLGDSTVPLTPMRNSANMDTVIENVRKREWDSQFEPLKVDGDGQGLEKAE